MTRGSPSSPPLNPRRPNPIIDLWSREDLLKVYMGGEPVCVNVEINQRCAGGCGYCYAGSLDRVDQRVDNLSFDKFREILALARLGTRVVYIYGGDQLLHPDCRAMVSLAVDAGFHVVLPLAGRISPQDVQWLVDAQSAAAARDQELFVGIHLDTLDEAVYREITRTSGASSMTLRERVDGYEALLAAGFPPDHTYGCPTLTTQTAATIIPLMDGFYAKGAKHVAIQPFRPLGLSKNAGAHWEPSLAQLKQAFYYRARVEGYHMLAVGCSDGRYACQGHVAVTVTGDVVPCLLLRDFPAGNIYQSDILTIVGRSREQLLLRFPVKGPCATCKSSLYCCGCRANAYLYSGDITASDPKCFFNPEAPDRCL